MAALPPYSNPVNFTLTTSSRPGQFSDPYTFALEPDAPAGTGNPYSEPYFFELIADTPVPPNPFSDPYTYTLTGDNRPGPFSDPLTFDTRSQVWYVATDEGWVVADMLLFV